MLKAAVGVVQQGTGRDLLLGCAGAVSVPQSMCVMKNISTSMSRVVCVETVVTKPIKLIYILSRRHQ